MGRMMIPKKPDHVTWTDEQWKAIHAAGQDILVAAAAGSGKTAVLVERIINKILSVDDPVDVDELLVVTFTNASAAEMRNRIGEALEKAINENPASRHLRRQLSLLNRASISTLHSFCLEVIRKYYYQIDIDPAFRIADDTEADLLRIDVLDELFEEEYGLEGNDAFFALVDTFSGDRSDVRLQEMVLALYDFSMSNPSPKHFLESLLAMYQPPEGTALEELPFVRPLLFDITLQLEGARSLVEKALELSRKPGGPAPRAENYLDDLKQIDMLLAAGKESWESLYEAMQAFSMTRAKTCRGDAFDKELLEQAKNLREQAKNIIKGIQEELFSRQPESFLRDLREMAPHFGTLARLVEKFADRFSKVKAEKGLVDFADLEHFTLKILGTETEEGILIPTDAALSYRAHFKEVFVDEYQDTNMVQEAILGLVTRDGEASGNLFMVGDVKQSIYRFRLAEPHLFLQKYRRFTIDGENSGLRIDLNRNFRSRREVLDATNYLFKQIMGEKVGEIVYDADAELVKGAPYPEDEPYPVEVLLISRDGEEEPGTDASENPENPFDPSLLEQSELEAKAIAAKIKELITERKNIYNPKTNQYRPIMYRDIVILLRSMGWAPQIMEELKEQGIPVYAELSTGYFEATEISIMLSLLKVIDNPYQDIPLAAVLRSPIVGLNEEELAEIRICDKRGSFYEALKAFVSSSGGKNEELYEKTRGFISRLETWRTKGRQGSLAELIWQLYCDTRFYDYVGGLPGGKQRQANLRSLYDRARKYEETSFRGLFRFLRFIDRMKERGEDLGAARSLGEQEDVVRIMTIHSSKGLEFPVVFLPGLARQFNFQDLNQFFMLDKEFGLAAKYVNAEKRISYPSLPQLAFRRKKKLEMLAEEMRVLYVALTRSKEKLYLLASVKEMEKKLAGWSEQLANTNWLLPEYERVSAKCYLDWLGPALIRHKDCEPLRRSALDPAVPFEIMNHPSVWKIKLIEDWELQNKSGLKPETDSAVDYMELVYRGKTIPLQSAKKEVVQNLLNWRYPYQASAVHFAKQSVSELKRARELADEHSGKELLGLTKPILTRPRFMQEQTLTPAERGTAMHMVMQHIDLSIPVTEMSIAELLDEMVQKELLTEEQKQAVDIVPIVAFFQTELGKRMLKARKVVREIPFSTAFPAKNAYPGWKGNDEPVLIQGVIDCVFEDEKGIVLVDYKTDAITGRFKGGFSEAKEVLENRYRTQIDLYGEALEKILKMKVSERYLFFFDGGHILNMSQPEMTGNDNGNTKNR